MAAAAADVDVNHVAEEVKSVIDQTSVEKFAIPLKVIESLKSVTPTKICQ